MKHLINNTNKGELAPWITLDSEGVHYSCGVEAEDPNYVDLGLPSGTLWAKCNVGAENEWEYGKYFQWGDTVGYYDGEGAAEHSSWSTAPFNNGSSVCDETYFASVSGDVCPNGVLANQYDAAYVATNGKEHMPTTADTVELVNNTTSELVTDFNGSGINGMKFTSKTDPTKYIFIPASGYFLNGSLSYGGSNGYYWSSSLYSSNPIGAYRLYFNSGNVYPQSYRDRCFGWSVRGVVSKN